MSPFNAEPQRLPASAALSCTQTNLLYIDLLKKVLLGTAYSETEEYQRVQMRRGSWQARVFRPIASALASKSYYIHKRVQLSTGILENGLHWPANGLTMIGQKRLDNLQHCVESALADQIPGDVIETGVWRGGACILMRALLNLYGPERRVFVADSFCGVPVPDGERYPADRAEERREAFHLFDQLAVSLDEVRENFQRFGLLDGVVFLKGWFKDTLPAAPISKLAVMRLDGDLYESTWDALSNLYTKLQPGGYCIIDDYGGIAACRQAVEDYRRENHITDQIVKVDGTGVYWRRSTH